MLINLKEFCFRIATFNGLGERLGGSLFATLLAIPALFFLRGLYWFNNTTFFIAISIVAALAFIIINMALRHHLDRDPSVIVLDKFLAFIVVFAGIQPNIKIIVVGFLLFHLFRFFLPILSYRLWHINFYELPLSMFSGICAGILLNFFFRLVLWIGS